MTWGTAAEQEALATTLSEHEDLARFLRNEFERVPLARTDAPALAQALQAGEAGPALAALDAQGGLLARMDATRLDAGSARAFLEAHRVPQKDAAQLWRQALAQAERGRKRVLVHLGAPW